MLRKFCACLAVVFFLAISGCAENESIHEQKKETQTESTPTDVKPGKME